MFIGPQEEMGAGPLGPMIHGPGVLDPEPADGLGTNPCGPDPGPQGTRGGGGPPPPCPDVFGGPGDGP